MSLTVSPNHATPSCICDGFPETGRNYAYNRSHLSLGDLRLVSPSTCASSLFKQGTIDSRQFPRTPYGTETLENKFKFPKLWVILMMISGLQKTESRFQASGCRMKTARSRIKTLVSQSLKSCSRVKSLGISESWKPGPCLLVQPLKYTMQFFGFLGEFFLVFVFLFGCTRS